MTRRVTALCTGMSKKKENLIFYQHFPKYISEFQKNLHGHSQITKETYKTIKIDIMILDFIKSDAVAAFVKFMLNRKNT